MDDIADRILIHIGLPRCASTSLQHVFAENTAPCYLGKISPLNENSYHNDFIFKLTRRWLVFENLNQRNVEAIRSRLYTICQAKLQEEYENIILSDELLSGIGFGNFIKNLHPDPLKVFENIQTVFGKPHILLFIRHPMGLLKSYYKFLVYLGYNLTFCQFVERCLNNRYRLLQVLSYPQYVNDLYHANPNLHVFPMEWLVEQPDKIRECLEKFGLRIRHFPCENNAMPQKELVLRLQLNQAKLHGAGLNIPTQELNEGRARFPTHESDMFTLTPATKFELENFLAVAPHKSKLLNNLNLEDLGYFKVT